MNDLQRLAAEAALRKMFNRGWIDISAIDEILKMTSTVPDRAAHSTLRLLHCVDFKDMDPALQRQLPELVRACLNGVTIDIEFALRAPALLQAQPVAEQKPSRITRIFNRG